MKPNIFTPKRLKIMVVLVVLLLCAVVGFKVYQNSHFRITKTDPKLSSVSSLAPYIRVYFNRSIDSASLDIKYSEDFIENKTVKDKYVTFFLNKNLIKSQTYSITFKSIKSANGEVLTNKVLTFTAKDLPFKKLSEGQQATLIERQDEPLYEVPLIRYGGFDELLDQGLSAGQVENIKYAIYDYSGIVGKEFWDVTIDPKSIVITNHRSDSSERLNKADFNVKLDTPHVAHVEYDALYDSIHLQLRDSGGVLVYDSAEGEDL